MEEDKRRSEEKGIGEHKTYTKRFRVVYHSRSRVVSDILILVSGEFLSHIRAKMLLSFSEQTLTRREPMISKLGPNYKSAPHPALSTSTLG